MIVLAIISYALPNLTGRKRYDSSQGRMAFWLSNIGMIGMTVAFGVAGVAQVYLERKMKMDFMDVQNEISIHFVVLVICATMFTVGISLFIYDFIKYGKPTDEALDEKHDFMPSGKKINNIPSAQTVYSGETN